MTPSMSGRQPRWSRLAVAALFALLIALVAAPVSVGASRAHAQRRLTMLSYNLYLGANLRPLFAVPPGGNLIEVAARVYGQVIETDFPSRAELIAREVAEEAPALIGLQEVARWQTAPVTNPSDDQVTYDFLTILLAELEERGLAYDAVATNVNFQGALPISATTLARFTDRDVILARADLPTSQLKVSNPTSSTFQATLQVSVGGVPLPVPRGWSSVDVKIRGKSFRFVNTHLEAFSAPVRQLQAQELAAILAQSPIPTVLAGDLNTLRGDQADAYAIFTSFGFVDAWVEAMPGDPGYTAGQDADLRNLPSDLDHTVDYLMYTNDGCLAAVPGGGDILGEELHDRTPSGLWPSDHAGVAVALQIQSQCKGQPLG